MFVFTGKAGIALVVIVALTWLVARQSIFRQSGHRFGDENATNKELERISLTRIEWKAL